jgi:glucose/arabinose dehydrogenase
MILKPTHLPITRHLWLILPLLLILSGCDGAALSAPEAPAQAPAEATAAPATEASPTPTVATSLAETTEPQATEESPATTAAETTATVPPSAEPATAVPLPPLDAIGLELIPVASGLTKPLYLTHAGDDSGRLFVVEQAGRVMILQAGAINPAPFLDIISLVGSTGNEQGLLSLAFHPDFVNNGFFFVNYTDKQGDTVIARYQVSDNPDLADPASAKVLLTIDQPYANHNGGQLAFGPDGYLYIGMGDGGAANDPQNRAQNLAELLGKLLRIDVDAGDPYAIPETNPFAGNDQARPEIWSYGWRNPWRFSFDSATNDLYIADVGQNQYEEIHVELAGSPGGQNYGWRLMEGSSCFNPPECDPEALGLVLPVAEYDHSLGCSVTGGYVYRGRQFPELTGVYFYGDYCSGIIWGLRAEADGSWAQAELLRSSESISSFGQDQAGELYLVDLRGDLFQLGN